ncbi:hypothetical protein [Dyella amyloliquefaciens]|uniref:hypothetical protein n=1 Tax=Dyella amyloliquefaciens TaxID=1770545 RepID=UPI00102ECFEB|nr:hypothetical protein [Dyella amyloliquefaciens]
MANEQELDSRDQKLLGKMHAHYEQLSDEQLAAIVAKREDLTAVAQVALSNVLARRDAERIAQWSDSIRREHQSSAPPEVVEVHEEVEWSHRPGATSAYAKTVHIARWFAFIPAAFWAAGFQRLILRWTGFSFDPSLRFDGDQNVASFAIAGVLTAIIALGIGLWVCPAKKKRMPALILGAIYFANLAYGLATVSGPHSTSQLQKLLALDYILGMATCVMIVGVIWLRPRRQSRVEVAAG